MTSAGVFQSSVFPGLVFMAWATASNSFAVWPRNKVTANAAPGGLDAASEQLPYLGNGQYFVGVSCFFQ